VFDEPGIRHFGDNQAMKKLYVGNLPFSATESQVRELFEKHGDVNSVALIMDRETGRPRGFGFVEISDNGMAGALKLDGYELDGRKLNVNEAQDKPRNSGGGGRDRNSGGGGRDRW
jgi:RNA recognition motif-containing protein